MRYSDLFETDVNWVPPYKGNTVKEDGDRIIWIDVDKVDASWKHDTDFYVGVSGEGGIGSRYQKFGEWLKEGKPIEMSEISIGYKGQVTFGNGRHRFAWMRDHGVKALPMLVPHETAEEIERRFGTPVRKTVL